MDEQLVISVGKEYYVDLCPWHSTSPAEDEGEYSGTVMVTDLSPDDKFMVTIVEGLTHYLWKYGNEFQVSLNSAFWRSMEPINASPPKISLSFDDFWAGAL